MRIKKRTWKIRIHTWRDKKECPSFLGWDGEKDWTKGMRRTPEICTLPHSCSPGSIMQLAQSARESRHWNSYICHELPLLVCSGFPSLHTAPTSAPGYQLRRKRGQFSLQSSPQKSSWVSCLPFSETWMELKGLIYKIIIIAITIIIT